jgi:hypothetical protein
MPSIRLSVAGYAETLASALEELPRLEAALPSIAVPVGFLVGEASPMRHRVHRHGERIPGAWVDVVAGGGSLPLDGRAGMRRCST